MSELHQIKAKRACTETALAEAKRASRSKAYLTSIQNTLTEQGEKENLCCWLNQSPKQRLLEESVKPKGPVSRSEWLDIVKTWRIPDRTQDIRSNHVATLGTHSPDHLMRKFGRAREQSIVVEGWVALQTPLCQDDRVLGFEDVSSPGWVVVELQRQRELQALQVINDQSFVPSVVIGAPSMTRSNRYALFTTPVGLLIPDQMRLPVSAYAPLVTALKMAHSRNLYHNDIAPSSLFAVSSPLEVKVILNDWGSAASREELEAASSMNTRKLFYNIQPEAIFYLTQVTFVLDSASDCVELDAIMRQQLPVVDVLTRLTTNPQ
eukprot:gene34770-42106_t